MVLIVDDNEGISALLTRILEDADYETCTAGDGYEALQRFHLKKPNLV